MRDEPEASNGLRSWLTLWGRFKRCTGFDATWYRFGVVGRSSFIRDNLQWARDVTRTRVETRKRGLDECRPVEAKGRRFAKQDYGRAREQVVATKEELEGAFSGGERYLAGTGKAVSCWGEVGGNCVQMVEKL